MKIWKTTKRENEVSAYQGARKYHTERMEFHRKELEKLDGYGHDNFDDGDIVYFEKCFINRGERSKYYKYCAMKSAGQWYTCGPRSPGPYTWEQLIDFVGGQELFVVSPVKMSIQEYREDFQDWE
jgi:hypothetical protein